MAPAPAPHGTQDGLAGGDLSFFVAEATSLEQRPATQEFRGGRGGYSGGLQDGCLVVWHGCLARGGLVEALHLALASGSSHVTISRVTVTDTNRCHSKASIRPCACLCIGPDGSIFNPRMGRDHLVCDSSSLFNYVVARLHRISSSSWLLIPRTPMPTTTSP